MAPSLWFVANFSALVLLPVVFMSREIVFLIRAWCIKFFRERTGTFGCARHEQYVFLCLANFIAGRDRTTIQDTAQLTQLAYRSFELCDPLGWDIWDTLKLLACFVKQFGGGIYFICNDLAQSWLSN